MRAAEPGADRAPLEAFGEHDLVNLYQRLETCTAIYVRLMPAKAGSLPVLCVWLSLFMWHPRDLELADKFDRELADAFFYRKFYVEIHRVIGPDAGPSLGLSAACLYRKAFTRISTDARAR